MEVTAVENFRFNVKAAMEKQALSVRALAKQIGSSHPYVINMLKPGGTVPSLDRCEQIAEQLGIPLQALLRHPRKIGKIAS